MSRGNIEALAPYDIVCLLREGNVEVWTIGEIRGWLRLVEYRWETVLNRFDP